MNTGQAAVIWLSAAGRDRNDHGADVFAAGLPVIGRRRLECFRWTFRTPTYRLKLEPVRQQPLLVLHNPLLGSNRRDVLGVLAVVGLTTAVAVVGGAAGDFGSRWYAELRKPAWQPSGATIGTVWSVLYVSIAAAGSMLWLRRRRAGPELATLFVTQSLLNAAWTLLFTRAKRPDLAA